MSEFRFIPFTKREQWWLRHRRSFQVAGWGLIAVFCLMMVNPTINWWLGESLWELCYGSGCHLWHLSDLLNQ